MKRLIFAACALGLLTACGGTTISTQEIGAPGQDIVNQDQSFATVLNNMRIGNGANAVTYDSRLDAAAQSHAEDMVAHDYFSHTDRNGGLVQDRIRAQGYEPIAYGENIAQRQQGEQTALEGWENSPSHNRMLNANSLEEFGLGMAGTGSDRRWVLVMATEAP